MAIKFKGSEVSGVTPTPAEIEVRELAINLADKRLYTKDSLGNIIHIGEEAINTGLEKVGTGWRLVGIDPADYGTIGANSVDFNINDTGTNIGVTGANTFSAGYENTTSGVKSVVLGSSNTESTNNNVVLGSNNNIYNANMIALGSANIGGADYASIIGHNNNITSISAMYSCVFGHGLKTNAHSQVVLGKFNDNSSVNVVEVGFGVDDITRKNIFEIKSNGVASLPIWAEGVNITDIDNEGAGALITKGYLDNYTTETAHIHDNKSILDLTTASYTIEEKTKLGYITVTQAVDLDNIELTLTTKEDDLGNPVSNGYLLASDANGTRYWVQNPVTTSSFLSLTDTPADYANKDGYFLRVNGTTVAFETVVPSDIIGLETRIPVAPTLLEEDKILFVRNDLGVLSIDYSSNGLGFGTTLTTVDQTIIGAINEVNSGLTAIEADYLTSTDIGTTVQAWSAVLDGTQESFTTALKATYDALETNVTTNLSVGIDLSAGVTIESSDGTNATIQPSTTTTYGVVKAAVDPGDSTAIDVAGLVADYNTLLANLRNAGIIA